MRFKSYQIFCLQNIWWYSSFMSLLSFDTLLLSLFFYFRFYFLADCPILKSNIWLSRFYLTIYWKIPMERGPFLICDIRASFLFSVKWYRFWISPFLWFILRFSCLKIISYLFESSKVLSFFFLLELMLLFEAEMLCNSISAFATEHCSSSFIARWKTLLSDY